MTRTLMKGNEALAEAAIRGGCTHFFGYPITPQNEIPEYLARELPERGGVFLQAESEIASIHMVYGAAAAGGRVMTSSSSPGIALMQEGISMLASAELPCVIVNMQRGGPGIGGIQPAQADYYQMTRGGGNGDYRVLSYAPSTIQESVEMMQEAFEKADQYRTPVFIVGDGMLGQMMEPVDFSHASKRKQNRKKGWVADGNRQGREKNIVKTLFLDPKALEHQNQQLQNKYQRIVANETRYSREGPIDAEIVLVAYGSTARIVNSARELLQTHGIRAQLIRPQTLWPFPVAPFGEIDTGCQVICVEMSEGQMVDDVRLAVNGKVAVSFLGRSGGMIPAPADIANFAKKVLGGR